MLGLLNYSSELESLWYLFPDKRASLVDWVNLSAEPMYTCGHPLTLAKFLYKIGGMHGLRRGGYARLYFLGRLDSQRLRDQERVREAWKAHFSVYGDLRSQQRHEPSRAFTNYAPYYTFFPKPSALESSEGWWPASRWLARERAWQRAEAKLWVPEGLHIDPRGRANTVAAQAARSVVLASLRGMDNLRSLDEVTFVDRERGCPI